MGASPDYLLTPAARDDLFEIWLYISGFNPAAADVLEEDLFAAFAQVAIKPDLGHWRRDLTEKPVRFVSVRRR